MIVPDSLSRLTKARAAAERAAQWLLALLQADGSLHWDLNVIVFESSQISGRRENMNLLAGRVFAFAIGAGDRFSDIKPETNEWDGLEMCVTGRSFHRLKNFGNVFARNCFCREKTVPISFGINLKILRRRVWFQFLATNGVCRPIFDFNLEKFVLSGQVLQQPSVKPRTL